MTDKRILNDEGLFADPSVPQESVSAADENSILNTDSEDEITSAQKQRPPDAPKRHQEERPHKLSTRKRTQKNARDHDEHQPRKKPRQNHPETAKEIKEKIRKSEESIAKLKTHSEKGTCPKTLRYSARASIALDIEFKKEVSLIRKNAEKKFLDALTRFHYRRVERYTVNLRKLEQLESRKSTDVTLIKNRQLSAKEHADKIEQIQKKMSELTEKMMELEREQNKEVEPYPRVLSVTANSPKTKKAGKDKRSISAKKRREQKKQLQHDIAKKTMESKKAHIKNLSDYNLTRDEINLLSRGLNYIPTPVTNDSHIRKTLLKDFAAFERRMRLQFIFHGRDKKPHPFHVKSNWEPPVQPSVALETYLEEVKTQLAEIQISKPKNNLLTKEHLAIKELKQNPNINIKKADKGTSTVIMNENHFVNFTGATFALATHVYTSMHKGRLHQQVYRAT